ncbi:GNAT family N-acetyltransferase [Hymenobacter taeanensis]|uniref:GNAT family N-acetyltransferase n=1 Tax=Hymenobacter taeanensis TaxID=2735321 RepID=A0A6M6BDR1_9BACT|nr:MULTISPECIES: lysophospholipid acyltransferase family protein [Hymenobacter]QJX46376.1 GNAT family N-acetyltransferase [Hymenobacter taeanensis]UOQ80239.1 lysophospholipid acyltransferase family protein [Hymenobacter sp. 5414T-23]
MSSSPDFQLPVAGTFGKRAGEVLRPLWYRWAQLRSLQQLYGRHRHLQGREFIGQLLRDLNITLAYDPAELRRVPAQGAFVAIANHPSGMLDGLILLYLLGGTRPEFRAVANQVLAPLLPNLTDQLTLVNPDRGAAGSNVPTVRRLLRYLQNDIPLGLFPDGEVAYRAGVFQPAQDPAWNPTASRLLEAARVPVVPIWLSGQNSTAFSLLGLLHPVLRTARLPAELLNKRGQTIQVRIGQPITPATLAALPAPDRLAYLRARVYALRPGKSQVGLFPELPAPTVVAETDPTLLEADIQQLRPGRCLLRYQQWEVYVAKKSEIPHVLREIGWLRELTFRREGEGTQQAIDLDRYDEYYRHLFLYDRKARCLVGAYRVGRGRSILQQYGKRGFYLHSLFRMKKELRPLLREALELGRSFVREEYQKQPLPLALLWKGIAEYIARHPEYRYLIGPVSISNRFAPVSKAVMMEYLQRHCADPVWADMVKPRKQFKYRPLDAPGSASVLQAGLESLQDLQQFISGLEPGGSGVPVLLRQYIKQNARIIGFNLDPGFSNALDGFMVLDARELPARTHRLLERYTTVLS